MSLLEISNQYIQHVDLIDLMETSGDTGEQYQQLEVQRNYIRKELLWLLDEALTSRDDYSYDYILSTLKYNGKD